jgi:hypothetical protein
MAAVLAAMLVALSLWAISYQTLSYQVTLERHTATPPDDAPAPGIAEALAAAEACFRVSPPNPLPYDCCLTLGQGARQRYFVTKYFELPGGTVGLTVTAVPSCTNSPCSTCSGGLP